MATTPEWKISINYTRRLTTLMHQKLSHHCAEFAQDYDKLNCAKFSVSHLEK